MAQHPSSSSRAAVQSVWVHLVALQLMLERGLGAPVVMRAMMRLTAGQAALRLAAHARLTRRWADAVWQAWRAHHDAIRALAATA